jgi:hypothetical protein
MALAEGDVECPACSGFGGVYGPGYLSDGRHVDGGMWWACSACLGLGGLTPGVALRAKWAAARKAKETHMRPASLIGTVGYPAFSFEREGRSWVVRYFDNSDHGIGMVVCPSRADAEALAADLNENPPQGDHFHPAPVQGPQATVWCIERLA